MHVGSKECDHKFTRVTQDGPIHVELRWWFEHAILQPAMRQGNTTAKLCKLVQNRCASWIAMHKDIFGTDLDSNVFVDQSVGQELMVPLDLGLSIFFWAVAAEKRDWEARVGAAVWLQEFCNHIIVASGATVLHHMPAIQPLPIGMTMASWQVDASGRIMNLTSILSPNRPEYREWVLLWDQTFTACRNSTESQLLKLTNSTAPTVGEFICVVLLNRPVSQGLEILAFSVAKLARQLMESNYMAIAHAFSIDKCIALTGASGKRRRIDSDFKVHMLKTHQTVTRFNLF